MIRWVNIVGAHCNDTNVQHGQRPQEQSPSQCEHYDSLKHKDKLKYWN